ncbi:MAG: glycosyltransferase family 2 protein [Dokdonella sp.]
MLGLRRNNEQARLRLSLIILTYNWPEALKLVLASVATQSRLPDEVIITDDGSAAGTRRMIEEIAQGFPTRLVYLWQEDVGFRAARARNRGIAASRGDYVLVLDGDMLLHKHFIADHLMLAARGSFIQGTRLRASEIETRRLLAGGSPNFGVLIDAKFQPRHSTPGTNHFGKRYHAIRLPLLARWKSRSRRGGHIMSCNMAFWRDDLLRTNGFDERMESYGSEDLELAARLKNVGVRQRQLKFAGMAIHLEHASRADGDPDDPALPNNRILRATREEQTAYCERGISQHLNASAQAPEDLICVLRD